VLAASLVAAGALGCGGEESEDAIGTRPVTLALDFAPNAVHAGVYSTVREGRDRASGIRLRIRAPSASTDSLKLLASGRADFSIVDIHDLGLARERGQGIVGVGAIVQRPLAAVIARGDVDRPRDLEGRRVGVTGLPSDDAVLRAVVEHDRGDFPEVRRTTIGFSAVPSLVAGRVAAVTAFWNAEGVALRERGVRTREFRVDEFGAPRYPELVLVTRERTLARDRELVEDLVAALRAGTEDALADRDAAVRQIVDVSNTDERLVRAQLEAVAAALSPPLRLDREALEGWARFDVRFGILERRPDVGRAFALGLD
jgi:putative hydroxymethylpyrimidine transport system substrate-binding protein